ncbi:MAG: ankyrin repeat domain-containing protein [Betaproteobacteria bacterium]|nr:ankyrin repeat domain-containing protein [Betaproteobacteria bacterium]
MLFMPLSSAVAGSYDELLTAVKLNDLPVADALFARGMDVNTSDTSGNTLLMIAVRENHAHMARRLLQLQAKVGARNQYGESALMLAAANGELELVKLFVAHDAEVNMAGWNPLIYAAWRGRTEVVKYLLEKGADIDAVSPNGVSALMMAARDGHFDTVRLLLWEVADPNIKSESGATALGWARKAGNTEIADLLQQAGAKD